MVRIYICTFLIVAFNSTYNLDLAETQFFYHSHYADLPEIIVPVENFIYTIDEGLTVTFECSASGIPAPTITWFRLVGNMSTELNKDIDNRVSISDPPTVDDSYEPPDGRGTVFLVTSQLTLSQSNDNDSGMYSCQAGNEFGNATREFELIVQGKVFG